MCLCEYFYCEGEASEVIAHGSERRKDAGAAKGNRAKGREGFICAYTLSKDKKRKKKATSKKWLLKRLGSDMGKFYGDDEEAAFGLIDRRHTHTQ
jgi:hypothetical protein